MPKANKFITHGPTRHVEVVGPFPVAPAQARIFQDAINQRLNQRPFVLIEESDDPEDAAYPVDVRVAPFGEQVICVLTYRQLKL